MIKSKGTCLADAQQAGAAAAVLGADADRIDRCSCSSSLKDHVSRAV